MKRIRPGFWTSLDASFYRGGESTRGSEARDDLQRNSRLGATLVFPFDRRFALELGYSTGVVTTSGGDFDTILVSLSTLVSRR